jgi:hypothetical protein
MAIAASIALPAAIAHGSLPILICISRLLAP